MNEDQRPLLQIVVGSTRPGRVGPAVADWFADRARLDDRFEVELVDLADAGLPVYDEPHHPRLGRYVHAHTKRWSARIGRGDLYVFVIPEYNYTLNSATKNAIDYLWGEWAHKPLGIVSYGGKSAGLRAAQTLKLVGSALGMLTTRDVAMVPAVGSLMREDGSIDPTAAMDASVAALLDELHALTRASLMLRDAQDRTLEESP